MRSFDYSRLAHQTWDTDIVNLVAKIHECKGRQDLFIRQKPVELERLVEIAFDRCGNNTGASVYDDRGILFLQNAQIVEF